MTSSRVKLLLMDLITSIFTSERIEELVSAASDQSRSEIALPARVIREVNARENDIAAWLTSECLNRLWRSGVFYHMPTSEMEDVVQEELDNIIRRLELRLGLIPDIGEEPEIAGFDVEESAVSEAESRINYAIDAVSGGSAAPVKLPKFMSSTVNRRIVSLGVV
jgi:hypothetical protein